MRPSTKEHIDPTVRCNGAPALDAHVERDALLVQCSVKDLTKKGRGVTITGNFGARYDYGEISFEAANKTARIADLIKGMMEKKRTNR